MPWNFLQHTKISQIAKLSLFQLFVLFISGMTFLHYFHTYTHTPLPLSLSLSPGNVCKTVKTQIDRHKDGNGREALDPMTK